MIRRLHTRGLWAALPVVAAVAALAGAAPAQARLTITYGDGKTPIPTGSAIEVLWAPGPWKGIFTFGYEEESQEINCGVLEHVGNHVVAFSGTLVSNGLATDTISITGENYPYNCRELEYSLGGWSDMGEGHVLGTGFPWTLKLSASGHATFTPAAFELTGRFGTTTFTTKSMSGTFPVKKRPKTLYLGFIMQELEGPGTPIDFTGTFLVEDKVHT